MKTSIGAKTFVYPTPLLVVGSYDEEERPNLVTVAWGGVCCTKPPCVSISLRKATYSYASILRRQAFSVNIPSADQVAMVDFIGIYSGRDCDKFSELGLTAEKAHTVNAPCVKEFPLVMECEMRHVMEIGSHTIFVGEVKDTWVEQEILSLEGKPKVSGLNPLAYAPVNREYYCLGESVGKAFSVGKRES